MCTGEWVYARACVFFMAYSARACVCFFMTYVGVSDDIVGNQRVLVLDLPYVPWIPSQIQRTLVLGHSLVEMHSLPLPCLSSK